MERLIVLDADGVLWAGVAGDHTHPFYNVQEAYRDTGIPLALLTRNTWANLVNAFSHPKMVLRVWDFEEIVCEADKVRELTRLSQTYDLIYVDDEETECQKVRDALPDLRIVHAPPKEALGVARWLAGLSQVARVVKHKAYKRPRR